MITKHTVLIVDDEQGMLDLLRIFFERAQFRVITAETGLEALKLVERHMPDAIIMDYMLPDISGGEVCQMIKQTPTMARIPVIMHSANPRIIDPNYTREVGADDAVTKPCDVRKLIQVVESHLFASV